MTLLPFKCFHLNRGQTNFWINTGGYLRIYPTVRNSRQRVVLQLGRWTRS